MEAVMQPTKSQRTKANGFRRPGAKPRQLTPTCPEHKTVHMMVNGVKNGMRYCYCPVAGCNESQKQKRE